MAKVRMREAGLPGRSEELQFLETAITAAAAGLGQAVLVEGEPGIGKTALLDAAVSRARETGFRVLEGAGEELSRRVPFAAIARSLDTGTPTRSLDTGTSGRADGQAAALARLVRPEGGSVADRSPGADFATAEAVLGLLDEWCTAGPVALVVDDLHWADSGTLLLLHRLGKSLGTVPLLVVCASRPVPGGELDRLRRSLATSGAHGVTVGPLDETAVGELAEGLLGAPAGPGLRRLLGGAAGNPLFVTELLAALQRDEAIVASGGTAEVRGGDAPASLLSAIVGRLDWVSPKGQEILRAGSILGSGFTVVELSAVTGLAPARLIEPILEFVRYGVLTEQGERLVFRHDLIRQALYDGIPARAASHAAVGRALARSGTAVERVAEHLLLGAPSGEDTLPDWVFGNARALTLRAPGLAVELLEATLAVMAPHDPRTARLRVLLASSLLWTGRASEAEQRAEEALAEAHDAARKRELLGLLGRACMARGRPDLGAERVREALATGGLSTAETLGLEALLAISLLHVRDMDRAVDLAERVRAEAGELQLTAPLVDALHPLAAVAQLRGLPRTALEDSDQGLRIARAEHVHSDRVIALHTTRAFSLMGLDRSGEAEEAMESARRLAERNGSVLLGFCDVGRSLFMFHTGRWDDALAVLDSGRDLPGFLGVPRAVDGLAALIAALRGDLDTARERLEAADRAPRTPTTPVHEYLPRWAAQIMHEADGRPREALDDLLKGWEQGFGAMTGAGLPFRAADLVRLALSLGERDVARDVVAFEQRLAGTDGSAPGTRAIALHCQGLVDGDPLLMAEASGHYERSPRLLSRAQYHEDCAAVLAGAGRANEARTELDRAADLYSLLQADRCMAQAEARLGAAGVVRGRRGRAHRPSSGWGALTETERNVAALVGEGLSNTAIGSQLFISRRTVQSHVSIILRKLALTSRVEIAVEIARHV
ncbi:AAA family ATPase [Streptomyces sp. NPDC048639]|uniref:helix-turn-helix transcriptional regulator n=1 Tax=Streptomyces sp. NPDC048639 TaxID=3365581 RepID=UPI0037244822